MSDNKCIERLDQLAQMDPDGKLGFLMLKGIVNSSARPSPEQLVWVSHMVAEIQELATAEKTMAIVNIATFLNSCR